MTNLQSVVLSRFSWDISSNMPPWGDSARLYNATVCQVTGRSPTVVESMTDDECQTVLDALNAKAETEIAAKAAAQREAKEAREKALANERLRQSGRYGFLMADDELPP